MANSGRRTEGSNAMLDTQNQDPLCAACGAPMRLTAFEPGHIGQDLISQDLIGQDLIGQDLRTFTCPHCGRVRRQLIESTVTEAWLKTRRWGT
jgi:hypothetical protein